MVGGEDGLVCHGFWGDVPEEEFFPFFFLLHEEHLVEVTIKDFAFPADVDGVAAHEAFDGFGVEVVDEELVVVVPLALFAEIDGEACDGEVGDGEEACEDDAEVFFEFAFVLCFELVLIGREFCAEGVKDEGEGEVCAVSDGVELLEGGDGFIKDAVAALGVDVFCGVAGKGGDDFDLVFGEEFGEVAVFFCLDDGEVVAVDDVGADGAGGFYEVVKKFRNFWGSAGDVYGGGLVLKDPCADFVGAFFVHHFGAGGAGIDVAVGAGLVTLAADVDLEGVKFPACEGDVVAVEEGLEGVHELERECECCEFLGSEGGSGEAIPFY